MNEYGKNNLPFLFIIDFNFQNAYILDKAELDPYKVKFSFNNFANCEDKKVK